MRKCVNGEYLEMTPEEIAELEIPNNLDEESVEGENVILQEWQEIKDLEETLEE